MNEGAPKEDIYSVPDVFKFRDYLNQFLPFAMLLRNGLSFIEILKFIKENPIPTVEEYLNANADRKDISGNNVINQLETEYKQYPQKMHRLNQIVKEINSLGEDGERRFKELINEAKRLLSNDPNPVFPDENE